MMKQLLQHRLLLPALISCASLAYGQTTVINTDTTESNKTYTNNTADKYALEVVSGVTYSGTDINIDNSTSDSRGYAVYVEGLLSLAISGSNRNVITSNRSGIFINSDFGDEYESHIDSTDINAANSGVEIYKGHLLATDVNITSSATGIYAYPGTIEGYRVNVTAAYSVYSEGGNVILHDSTLNNTGNTVFSTNESGRITVSNSTVSNASGGTLYVSDQYQGFLTLNNVNLTNARNQRIYSYGNSIAAVTLNATAFDGYTEIYSGDPGSIHMTLTNGASWNVTHDSDLGADGSLTLGASSLLTFIPDPDKGDWTSITAAAVMLAEGSILQVGGSNASGIIDGDWMEFFTGASTFDDQGAIVISQDGYIMEIDEARSGNGTYYFTGNTLGLLVIPEPATASLGLFGLALLAMRRRKTA